MRLLILVGVGLAACTPLTAFRTSTRTGHAAPAPWTGATAQSGEVWVGAGGEGGEGAAINDSVRLEQILQAAFPQPGDPGLRISTMRGFAHARIGVSDSIELGFRGSVDHIPSERQTRIGVFDAGRGPAARLGPTFGGQVRVSDSVFFTGRAEAQLNLMPFTRYSLRPEFDPGGVALGDGAEFYVINETGVVRRLLWGGSAAFAWRDPKSRGDAHFGVAVSEQVTNDGFGDTKSDPAQRGIPAFFLVTGGAFQAKDVRIGGQIWMSPFDGNEFGGARPFIGAQLLIEARLARGDKE